MTSENFSQQLKQQIIFLENSSRLYDDGCKEEAIRIATVLRVLMYDTGSSKSLFTQINIKNEFEILSQSSSLQIEGKIFHLNMGIIKNGELIPNLGEGVIKNFLSIKEWLEQYVCIFDEDTKISKIELILGAANKDGGAHVDFNFTTAYQKIRNAGITEEQHLISLRQMAFEFLYSINFNKTKLMEKGINVE